MKELLTFLPLLIFSFINGKTQFPYQLKSAKIDFVFINGMQSGTKTLIFADSGRTEKSFATTFTDTSLFKALIPQAVVNKTSSRIMVIQTKDSVFTIDLNLLVGSRRQRFNLNQSSIIEDQKKYIGVDTFLNKKCEIVDFQGFKIWYWKGIALKKEMIIDDQKIYEYATSIDEHYLIRADEFQIPGTAKMQ